MEGDIRGTAILNPGDVLTCMGMFNMRSDQALKVIWRARCKTGSVFPNIRLEESQDVLNCTNVHDPLSNNEACVFNDNRCDVNVRC